MKLRHILCPFDFSEVSSHALEQATVLAQQSGARLTVLNVFLSVMPPTGDDAIDEATSQVIEPSEFQSLQDRARAAARHALKAGVAVDIVVMGGAPVATILERAATLGVDLIVMGTHGASGVQHLLLGSVTEKVLRKATCPVLTVPVRVHGAPAASFTHVLCAVDFSECSRHAVEAAAAIVEGSPATLTLLHVMEWPWHEPPVPGMEGIPPAQVQALLEYRRYLESSAVEGLKGIAASLAPNREVATAIRFGKSYLELLAAAREGGADLIVLGVRGRSAVDIGFFGSTTNHVVRGATCPVLTVRK